MKEMNTMDRSRRIEAAKDPFTGKILRLSGRALGSALELTGKHYVWSSNDECIDFYILCEVGTAFVRGVLVSPTSE
jgi:hypothetical protein